MLQAGRSPVRFTNEVDFFILPNPSSRAMTLESTQTLTEMSIRNLPGGKSGRRVGLTTLPPSMSRMSENVGPSTSRNPKGLHCLYRDNFTFYLTVFIISMWKQIFPIFNFQNETGFIKRVNLFTRQFKRSLYFVVHGPVFSLNNLSNLKKKAFLYL
jgi:hypothetical protein